MNVTEIAADAWLCVGKAYASNSLVLARGNDALLIDAVGSDADAVALRKFVSEDLGKRARFIIATHYFADHMAALRHFPEAEVITHERYRETWEIEQFRSEEEAEFYVEPSVVFRDRLQLRWGSFRLDAFENPGHTPSTIGVDIPELDLLVCGDSFVGRIAYIRYGDPAPALRNLIARQRGRHIASHGGLRDDDPPSLALSYLTALRGGQREFELTPFERIFHERNLEDIESTSF